MPMINGLVAVRGGMLGGNPGMRRDVPAHPPAEGATAMTAAAPEQVPA